MIQRTLREEGRAFFLLSIRVVNQFRTRPEPSFGEASGCLKDVKIFGLRRALAHQSFSRPVKVAVQLAPMGKGMMCEGDLTHVGCGRSGSNISTSMKSNPNTFGWKGGGLAPQGPGLLR